MFPVLSTARYRYFHWPLIRTSVSSIRQLPPTRRLRGRKAWSSNGAYLSIQRLRLEWSTSTPSFFRYLLELAVADRLRHIPAHTPKDDLPRKVTAFEIDHRGALRCPTDHDHIPTGLGVQLCDRTRGGVAPLVCAAARMSRPIDCPIARRKSVCRMVHIAPAPTEHDLPVRGPEAALRNPRGVAWWVRDSWDGTIQIET